jgi:hypothetical protein
MDPGSPLLMAKRQYRTKSTDGPHQQIIRLVPEGNDEKLQILLILLERPDLMQRSSLCNRRQLARKPAESACRSRKDLRICCPEWMWAEQSILAEQPEEQDKLH